MLGRRAQRNFSEAPSLRNLDEISQRPRACIKMRVCFVHLAKESPRAHAVPLVAADNTPRPITSEINEIVLGIPTNPGDRVSIATDLRPQLHPYLRSLSFFVIAW